MTRYSMMTRCSILKGPTLPHHGHITTQASFRVRMAALCPRGGLWGATRVDL